MTDVTIPRQVWSSWTPDGGGRKLRRELTDQERGALVARRNELAPAIAPYPREDIDRVVLALGDMFGGFTSMRQTDDEAVAKLDSVRRILADYPAWAIEKACTSIQTNGVWRDGKFDRRWPPNDSEIVAEVRAQARLYAGTHQNITAMLEAKVES